MAGICSQFQALFKAQHRRRPFGTIAIASAKPCPTRAARGAWSSPRPSAAAIVGRRTRLIAGTSCCIF